jgi:1,4-dihydroxy-2-naphthoate octaprenyltransferase
MSRLTVIATLKDFIIHLRLKFNLYIVPIYLYGIVLSDGTIFTTSFVLEFLIIHLFLYGGINALNDYYDRHEEGPIGGLQNPPPVHGDSLFYLAWLWKLIGLYFSLKHSTSNFVILYLIGILISVGYSHPSVRLKSSPLWSLIIVGFLQGFGAYCSGAKTIRSSFKFYTGGFVITLITIGFYPLTQIYQIEQDRRQGDKTLAIYLGVEKTFQFSFMCLLISGLVNSLLIGYYYHWWQGVIVFFYCLLLIYRIILWRNKFDRQSVLENFQSLHHLITIHSIGVYAFCLAHLL